MCVAGLTNKISTSSVDIEQDQDTMTTTTTTTMDDSSNTKQQRASRRRSSSAGGDESVVSSASASSLSKRAKRTYVEHTYTDHYNDPIYNPAEADGEDGESPKRRGPRGGVVVPFPERLYTMLSQVEKDGEEDVVSWQPHGRCFIVHQPKRFVEEVMPKYFRQSKLTSFQRQVNLYGFRRLTAGKDRGGYYHEMFLRGRPDLHRRLVRIRVKGTGFKSASSPATEPDFYAFPRCTESGPSKIKMEGASAAAPTPALVQSSNEDSVTADPATSMDMDVSPGAAVAGEPLWKPLCAPPSMVPSSSTAVAPPAQTMKPLDTPQLANLGGDIKKSSQTAMNHQNWKPMSLSSFARSIVCDTAVVPNHAAAEACPITPEASVRQLVSTELDHALSLVGPIDAADEEESSAMSPFPSMISLEQQEEEDDSAEYEDLLVAPLPSSSEESRLTEYQQEAAEEDPEPAFSTPRDNLMTATMMMVDESIANNILIDNIEVPMDYSLDPLLLLDEVTGPVSCC